MQDENIDRRRAMLALGAGTAAVATVVFARDAEAADSAVATSTPVSERREAPAPVFPPGISANGYSVVAVSAVVHGAMTIALENGSDRFTVDACARDVSPDAPKGPASTERFDLFIVNRGSGSTPTDEARGIATIELARAMRSFESAIVAPGLMTLRDRVATHGEEMISLG